MCGHAFELSYELFDKIKITPMTKRDDDFDLNTQRYCGRCNKKIPGFNFHLAAGYCDDCFQEIEREEDKPEDLGDVYINEPFKI